MAQRYEYKTVCCSDDAGLADKLLAEYAVAGWRLHTAIHRGGACGSLLLIFEREVPSVVSGGRAGAFNRTFPGL